MIIDPRRGSSDLIETRHDKTYLVGTNIPIAVQYMRAGDISFVGNGPGGQFIPIGIEYKKFGDLLSCLCSGRFSGTQLPLLREDYPGNCWLLIEGMWRGNPTSGLLEHQWKNKWTKQPTWVESKIGSRRFTEAEFNGWLFSQVIAGGVRLLPISPDRDTTVQLIKTFYRWWTHKEYDEHRSHLAPDESDEPTRLLRKPITQEWRSRQVAEGTARRIEGIGLEKAKEIGAKFGTVERMVTADVKDWMQVDGIGKTLAERALRDLRGK